MSGPQTTKLQFALAVVVYDGKPTAAKQPNRFCQCHKESVSDL